MSYAFRDTELAARRLIYLAGVFADTTRDFVIEAIADTPGLVIDLGCGPGCTTRLLAEATGCPDVVGLDESEYFLSIAAKGAPDGLRFIQHDVTVTPFPAGPADLMFCRYLLTHIGDPAGCIAGWATQLKPGGLLLCEEDDRLEVANPVFREYIDIVTGMLAAQSNTLEIGPILDNVADSAGLTKVASSVIEVRPPDHESATMFYMNIQTWKHNRFILDNYESARIEDLEARLKAASEHESRESTMEFHLRRLVFRR